MFEREIKVDFYHLVMPRGAHRSFEQILEDICASPDDATRNLGRRDGDAIRLQESRTEKGTWDGELLRIRMHELPIKANLEGRTEPFQFEDDEGLGEETAFLFHPASHALALQRNRSGVPATAFAEYFEDKSGLRPIELRPVLRHDVMKRLAGLKEIRRFEIAIAGARNPEFWRQTGLDADALIRLSREFQAPTISVTVSMGHKKGELAETVKAWCRALKTLVAGDDGRVERLVATGRTDEEGTTKLDLLEYRVSATVRVNVGQDRRLTGDQRRHVVQQAWKKCGQEVVGLLGSEDRTT